jgi:hypothetical protein
MLGFSSVNIFLAYTLTILSAVACVVYGILNWNKGGDPDEKELNQEKQWMKEEQELDKELG